MFLTRKHLSRRTLLKGVGVSLALPLLDAMIPAGTALAQTAAARKLRVGFFYLPHGAVMDQWTPSGSGAAFNLNVITKPLEPYKKYVTSFGNIKNDAAAGNVHTRRPGTWLCALPPAQQVAGLSTTLDQVIAGHIAQDTPFPSLQVSSETTNQQAAGGGVISATSISFRDETTPLRMEFNPRVVFLRLFGAPDRVAASNEAASLLDLFTDQTRALQRDLGTADRATLDSHLTAVREAERRLPTARGIQNLALPPIPKGPLDDFNAQVDLMFDLIALAYRADLTRVVSFMMAAEGTNQTYNHIGVPDSFHPISHHANQPEKIARLVKIQTWHMERFAAFLGKLAAVPDGEGTLLDNAMFLYGSNMSNSDTHSSHPLPTLLVGGGAGKLSGGRHLELPSRTPITNLHLTLLEAVGLQRQSFGDSTGTIAL